MLMILTSVMAQIVCDGKEIFGYSFKAHRKEQVITLAVLVILMFAIMIAIFFIFSTIVDNELTKQNDLVYLMFR